MAVDKRFSDDLERMIGARKKADKKLRPPAQPGAIDDSTGKVLVVPVPADTAGIASPISETKYADRVFYPASTITSTDGIFTIEIKRVKTLQMVDAKSRSVILEFADKT